MQALKDPPGKKGENGDTGEQGSPGDGVKLGHLTVYKHVNKSGGPNPAKASDYNIHVDRNNQSSHAFQGSEDGTDVTIGFGSYSVSKVIGPRTFFWHHSLQ